jgi:hypothetical protein
MLYFRLASYVQLPSLTPAERQVLEANTNPFAHTLGWVALLVILLITLGLSGLALRRWQLAPYYKPGRSGTSTPLGRAQAVLFTALVFLNAIVATIYYFANRSSLLPFYGELALFAVFVAVSAACIVTEHSVYLTRNRHGRPERGKRGVANAYFTYLVGAVMVAVLVAMLLT